MSEDKLTESWVWQQFVKHWPGYAERHEPGIGAGDPDVWVLPYKPKPLQLRLPASIAKKTKGLTITPIGAYAAPMGMIELKAPSRIDLRPAQWAWHERWQRMGGFVPVLTCDRWQRREVRWMMYAPEFNGSKRELVPLFSSAIEWSMMPARLARVLGWE
jgi:hypothetical protein